eukprot:g3245.t1
MQTHGDGGGASNVEEEEGVGEGALRCEAGAQQVATKQIELLGVVANKDRNAAESRLSSTSESSSTTERDVCILRHLSALHEKCASSNKASRESLDEKTFECFEDEVSRIMEMNLGQQASYENNIRRALIETYNGDVDDCGEWTRRATRRLLLPDEDDEEEASSPDTPKIGSRLGHTPTVPAFQLAFDLAAFFVPHRRASIGAVGSVTMRHQIRATRDAAIREHIDARQLAWEKRRSSQYLDDSISFLRRTALDVMYYTRTYDVEKVKQIKAILSEQSTESCGRALLEKDGDANAAVLHLLSPSENRRSASASLALQTFRNALVDHYGVCIVCALTKRDMAFDLNVVAYFLYFATKVHLKRGYALQNGIEDDLLRWTHLLVGDRFELHTVSASIGYCELCGRCPENVAGVDADHRLCTKCRAKGSANATPSSSAAQRTHGNTKSSTSVARSSRRRSRRKQPSTDGTASESCDDAQQGASLKTKNGEKRTKKRSEHAKVKKRRRTSGPGQRDTRGDKNAPTRRRSRRSRHADDDDDDVASLDTTSRHEIKYRKKPSEKNQGVAAMEAATTRRKEQYAAPVYFLRIENDRTVPPWPVFLPDDKARVVYIGAHEYVMTYGNGTPVTCGSLLRYYGHSGTRRTKLKWLCRWEDVDSFPYLDAFCTPSFWFECSESESTRDQVMAYYIAVVYAVARENNWDVEQVLTLTSSEMVSVLLEDRAFSSIVDRIVVHLGDEDGERQKVARRIAESVCKNKKAVCELLRKSIESTEREKPEKVDTKTVEVDQGEDEVSVDNTSTSSGSESSESSDSSSDSDSSEDKDGATKTEDTTKNKASDPSNTVTAPSEDEVMEAYETFEASKQARDVLETKQDLIRSRRRERVSLMVNDPKLCTELVFLAGRDALSCATCEASTIQGHDDSMTTCKKVIDATTVWTWAVNRFHDLNLSPREHRLGACLRCGLKGGRKSSMRECTNCPTVWHERCVTPFGRTKASSTLCPLCRQNERLARVASSPSRGARACKLPNFGHFELTLKDTIFLAPHLRLRRQISHTTVLSELLKPWQDIRSRAKSAKRIVLYAHRHTMLGLRLLTARYAPSQIAYSPLLRQCFVNAARPIDETSVGVQMLKWANGGNARARSPAP